MVRSILLVGGLLVLGLLLFGCSQPAAPAVQTDTLLPDINMQELCNQLSLREVKIVTGADVVLKDNPYDCLYVNSDGVLVVGFGQEKRSLDAIKQVEEDLQQRKSERLGESYVAGSVQEIDLAGSRAITKVNMTHDPSPYLYWERNGQTFHMFLGLGSVHGYNSESWLAILTNLAQASD